MIISVRASEKNSLMIFVSTRFIRLNLGFLRAAEYLRVPAAGAVDASKLTPCTLDVSSLTLHPFSCMFE